MANRTLCSVVLVVLFIGLAGSPVLAQVRPPDYSQGKALVPNVFGPYTSLRIPAPNLTNSPRVDQLVKEGKLYLSVQDAIELALENNLDINVARYNPQLADTDILRTKAGGVARGLAGTGTASALGITPTGSFDPIVTANLSWDRRTIPFNNIVTTGIPSVTAQTSQGNFVYSQAFKTGTSLSLTWNNQRQSSTSRFLLFNPALGSTVQYSFTQHLLNGFGIGHNTRFIRIAKNNRHISDSLLKQQIITTLSSVLNQYWDLVTFREQVKVAEHALQLAEKLYQDNKRQVEIGTLAPIEVVRAESEVARTRQDLIVAQTALQQQQTLLKNSLSKTIMDATLAEVEIVPTDAPAIPRTPEVIPYQDAVQQAWKMRPEIEQSLTDLKNRDLTLRGTRNALLPSLDLVGVYGGQGLSGDSLLTSFTPTTFASGNPVVDANGNPIPGNFVPVVTAGTTTVLSQINRGLSQAWTQAFHGNFPQYTVALSLSIPIRNRSAQADNARAVIEERQAEIRLQQLRNQVAVEVRNAQIAQEQNRARVEAAQKARILAEQTLDAEQKRYALGASTIFLVIQAQRDLSTAQGVELRATSDFMKSRVELDRALGRTLDAYHVQMGSTKTNDSPLAAALK